ncbi:MAG: hypothetical protein HYX96_01280 [Chloroflexi bacterium]|nr:hypothetical protein [Chloroflexota bacterium]
MSATRQLYELNELDAQVRLLEQSLAEKLKQVGESQALIDARGELASTLMTLDELKKKQRSVETDADDLTVKIKACENDLYSGRIRNPKELSSLQHEVSLLKSRRDELDTRALGLLERVEATEKAVVAARKHFARVETAWRAQQSRLTGEIQQARQKLDSLKKERQSRVRQVLADALSLYENLRTQKGHAVSRVEQGICSSCRISLSSSQVQQARGGNLVQCGSCGRILFLP